MIEIRPAIDLIDGKCVRLTKGDFSAKKVYSEDPFDMARQFEDIGIQYLHLVDLDGAKQGRVINYKVLEKIASFTRLKIDFGGGLRSDKDLQIAFECGAKQITAGSIAVKEKTRVVDWLSKYSSEKIILGADVKNERIAISGWQEESDLYLIDFLNEYIEKGARYVICTDVSRDGLLEGPAIELYKKVLGEVKNIHLIASGGVSTLKDIDDLIQIGVKCVIIGKAIYEGRITLNELRRFLC